MFDWLCEEPNTNALPFCLGEGVPDNARAFVSTRLESRQPIAESSVRILGAGRPGQRQGKNESNERSHRYEASMAGWRLRCPLATSVRWWPLLPSDDGRTPRSVNQKER